MPGWRELEARWEQGGIGSRVCMAGQIALLDASRDELDQCLASMVIDPGFAAFAAHVADLGIPLHIISDGLDYAIHTILETQGIRGVPVIANRLRQVGERRWALHFPWHDNRCLHASGVCKCAVAGRLAVDKFLMIGDGRSDFCVSQHADHVFAKKGLVNECRRLGLAHTVVNDFSDASRLLDQLLQLPRFDAVSFTSPMTIRGTM